MAFFSILELEKTTPFSSSTKLEYFFGFIEKIFLGVYFYQVLTGRKDNDGRFNSEWKWIKPWN